MSAASRIFGILNLHKPPGVTSRDVVNVVQRLVKPAKCGHAGTLDPMATGVLLVCIGQATRLTSFLQQGSKTYEATFQLGVRSDTDDNTGEIRQVTGVIHPPSTDQLKAALQAMVGVIQQVPPAFSAVHIQGARAYSLARQGVPVHLPPKPVTIHRIELLMYDWPFVELEIACGSGTYIRSMARDLGNQLSCGGLMTSLQRTAVGNFLLADSISPDLLTADTISGCLIPASLITASLPQYICLEADVLALGCGRRLILDPQRLSVGEQAAPAADFAGRDMTGVDVALRHETSGTLLGIAELRASRQELQPRMVFC